MDSISSSTAAASASSATLGSVQGAASVSVLKKALNAQAAGTEKLLASVAQPALATEGSLGTQVNAFA